MRSRQRKAAQNVREAKPAVWCGICNIRVAPFALTIRVIGNQVFHESCLERGRASLSQIEQVSQSQTLID